MKNPLAQFVARSPASIIDDVREEAARVCDETARWQRGERGPLRTPDVHPLIAEGSDAAFGVAAEVAMAVGNALSAKGQRFTVDFPWTMAATLLRGGWQRGHRIELHVIGKERPS